MNKKSFYVPGLLTTFRFVEFNGRNNYTLESMKGHRFTVRAGWMKRMGRAKMIRPV